MVKWWFICVISGLYWIVMLKKVIYWLIIMFLSEVWNWLLLIGKFGFLLVVLLLVVVLLIWCCWLLVVKIIELSFGFIWGIFLYDFLLVLILNDFFLIFGWSNIFGIVGLLLIVEKKNDKLKVILKFVGCCLLCLYFIEF